MIKPKTVLIQAKALAIQWEYKFTRTMDGEHLPGGMYNKRWGIRIGRGQRRPVKRESLMHELLHALWEEAGLRDYVNERTEEIVVGSLTGYLVDVLRDNPELVEFLTEEDK